MHFWSYLEPQMKKHITYYVTKIVTKLTKSAPVSIFFRKKNLEKTLDQNWNLVSNKTKSQHSACAKFMCFEALQAEKTLTTANKMTTLAKLPPVFRLISQKNNLKIMREQLNIPDVERIFWQGCLFCILPVYRKSLGVKYFLKKVPISFRKLSKKFLDFELKKIQQDCQSCILLVLRNVLTEKKLKKWNFIFFLGRCKNIRILGKNFLAGLTKLNSTSPKEHFEVQYFFWKIHLFIIFRNFSGKLSAGCHNCILLVRIIFFVIFSPSWKIPGRNFNPLRKMFSIRNLSYVGKQ